MDVANAIANVETKIEAVEERINKAEQSYLSALEAGKQSLADYWSEKQKQLRVEKQQLQEEQLKLLDRLTVPSGVATGSVRFVRPRLISTELEALDSFLDGTAGIPLYPGTNIPLFGNRPSLLLHDLPRQDTTQFDEFVRSGTRFLVVPGTSGAGKTRTLYGHLAKKFGFFFVSNDMGNGGSADLRQVSMLMTQHLTEDRARNYTVAVFMVTVLLLVRMLIFNYCRSKGIAPEKWLMLQVGCQRLVKHGTTWSLDIFRSCTLRALNDNAPFLSGSSVNELRRQAQKAVSELLGSEQLPLLVVDEAQELVKLYRGKFCTDMPPYQDRPLAKPVLAALLDPGNHFPTHHVVYAGTGFLLHFQRVEFSSSAGKPICGDDIYQGIGGWSDENQMADYARYVLGAAWDASALQTVQEAIFPYFRGRFRPFVTLLEQVIMAGKHIKEVWKDVLTGLTTKAGVPGVQKSFYKIVEETATGARGLVGNVDVHDFVDLLLHVVVQYYYFGRSYSCPIEADQQENDLPSTLLEVAMGRTGGLKMVVIDEPLVLIAMHNFFLDTGKIRRRMLNELHGLNSPSSSGFWWEHVFPLEIADLWAKHEGRLDQMELFRDMELSENLEALKSMKSHIMEGSSFKMEYGTVMPPVVIYKADKRYNCHDYLAADAPGCKFFVAENSDILFKIMFEDSTIVWVSVQLTLRKALAGAEARDAVWKAEPSSEYDCRGDMLCLLFAYPASVDQARVTTRQVGKRTQSVVVVDRQNAHKFIAEHHLKNLDLLKLKEEEGLYVW